MLGTVDIQLAEALLEEIARLREHLTDAREIYKDRHLRGVGSEHSERVEAFSSCLAYLGSTEQKIREVFS